LDHPASAIKPTTLQLFFPRPILDRIYRLNSLYQRPEVQACPPDAPISQATSRTNPNTQTQMLDLVFS
ncbi:MAG: hypothetical protein WB509_06450, partial [Acetobacteraceae bacterium]